MILPIIIAKPERGSFLGLGLGIVLVILAGYGLIFAVSGLPQTHLRKHIQDAQAEGYIANNCPMPSYPKILKRIFKRTDMYTECVGLGIAVNMYPNVESLLSMPTFGECSGLAQAATRNFEDGGYPYMRYMHGYQIYLKPLYTLFTIEEARLITIGITLFLIALLFFTLQKSMATTYAAVVVLSFFVTRPPSVFLLATHAPQFWVVLVAAMLAVRLRNRTSPLVLFGVIGACDAFFSFLNMGSLSLGLPLLCYALSLWWDEKTPGEISGAIFWGGVGWSIGFVAPWLIKWGVLELVLHPTKEQLFGQTLDVYPTRNIQMVFTALYRNIIHLYWRVGLVIAALLIIRRLWRRPSLPSGLWAALLPGLVPVVWICILPGQSGIQHAFFINVILWPSIAALFLLLLAMPNTHRR